MDTLLSDLPPHHATTVAGLWRALTAARYSTELMTGRAVRLYKELSREWGACRDELEALHADAEAQLQGLHQRVSQRPECRPESGGRRYVCIVLS